MVSGIAMSRAAPIGALMVNTHRQPASEVRTPPRITPSADHTDLVDAVLVRTVERADTILDATDTSSSAGSEPAPSAATCHGNG